MHLKDLKETPELHDGDRRSPEYRLCNPYTTPKGVSWITPRSDGHTLEQDLEIFYSGKTVFCGDKKLGVIISILDAPRTNIIKEYFQGPVVHEEAIDTCEAYRQNGITANFYYSVIKSKLSILSDYKHYSGTMFLWKSVAKKKDIVIQIFKNHKLIEEDYDLITDPLKVWSSNQFLIFATSRTFLESLKIVG